MTRLRFSMLRFRGYGSGMGRGVVFPEMGSSEIPEPDEELPDSDLPDHEREQAIARERWRRDGR